ncbi:MAG: dynamin family protein [Actinobacteria bacterium]|nr:dynamin family protein [Actinomycetota bacterium]MCL5445992.1 dynamin family protein [Actinomycetota bacterium]
MSIWRYHGGSTESARPTAGLLQSVALEMADAMQNDSEELSRRTRRVAERLGSGKFHISIIGEFKRGKSTFVNALLGAQVLPTGVIPLTATAVEVTYGEKGAVVVYENGTVQEIAASSLGDYVTECGNPGNEKHVSRVEVTWPAGLLEPGIVLVDTPGIASINAHNDAAAQRAILDTDGAVVVLSADAPLSQHEKDLILMLQRREKATYYVVNKIDHLGPGDLDKVMDYVDGAMTELNRVPSNIWYVSAAKALSAKLVGRALDADSGEFGNLEATLRSFGSETLDRAVADASRKELRRIASEWNALLDITGSTLRASLEQVSSTLERLGKAASAERSKFDDSRVLLKKGIDDLDKELSGKLEAFVSSSAAQGKDLLAVRAAAYGTTRSLENDLVTAAEKYITDQLDGYRRELAVFAESEWARLAERLKEETQERVNKIREVASELVGIALPEVDVPTVDSKDELFTFIFLHVGSDIELLSKVSRRLLPGSIARRKMLDHVADYLTRELDKHAGRARYDLMQRLRAVSRDMETHMLEEMGNYTASLLSALEKGKHVAGLAEQDKMTYMRTTSKYRFIVGRVMSLCTDGVMQLCTDSQGKPAVLRENKT